MSILRRLCKTRTVLCAGGLGVAMIVAGVLIGLYAPNASPTSEADRPPAAGLPGIVHAGPSGSGLPTDGPPNDSTAAAQASDCTPDAEYEADVTIPDNTFLEMGEPFVKTWRIRNTGTCAWTSGYRLQFVAGATMGGPDAVSVPETAPGSSVEVSVELVAPSRRGAHRGDWQMRSDGGESFGPLLYIQIIVTEPAEQ